MTLLYRILCVFIFYIQLVDKCDNIPKTYCSPMTINSEPPQF